MGRGPLRTVDVLIPGDKLSQNSRVVAVGEIKDDITLLFDFFDSLAFAAVGRYNEFENLRIAGIRYADLRGYSYDRRDVNATGLVNAYAQQLGATFSSAVDKPFEVDLIVAEVGASSADDQIFRVGFDGTITDEPRFAVVGGATDKLQTKISAGFDPDSDLDTALELATRCFANGAVLEMAVLDRTRPQARKFRRIGG